MKAYDYVAVDTAGQAATGRTFATCELELDRELESQGLVLTGFSEVSGRSKQRRLRVKKAELILMTTQLATMTSAGVRIVEGIESIGQRMPTEAGRRLCQSLVASLRAGQSLSEAMQQHPRTFPEVYRASIRAGEASGALDIVMRRLAKHLEWARAMRATTIQALIYPSLLFFALTVLVLVLLNFVLPRILTMFPGGREDLPRETQLVLGLSDFLRQNALLLGLGVAGLVLAFISALKRPATRVLLSKLLLVLPRFGPVARQLATSKFASTCSTLHQAGCDVFTMLSVAGQTCGNAALAASFGRAAEGIRRGLTITQALEREADIDPLLIQMVAVGEDTGELDVCLARLVEYYDEEIPRIVKKFLAFLEPVMMMAAGLVVALILLAALMPIFELYENM